MCVRYVYLLWKILLQFGSGAWLHSLFATSLSKTGLWVLREVLTHKPSS